MEEFVWDIEATGFLDESAIDYTASPYKLKDDFHIHCVVLVDIHNTDNVVELVGEDQIREELPKYLSKARKIIAHNQISYDLLAAVCLFLGIHYEFTAEGSILDGRYVDIIDTLVVSKTLNPDRYGGHSIEAWGKRLGLEKIDWRARAVELGLIAWNDPAGAEFKKYHPEMLVYCVRDCKVNVKVYWALVNEMGDWDWSDAIRLEHAVRDIITRQEHRGFKFNRELAEAAVRDLDEKMEAIRKIVEPLLPPKPMGKTKLKDYMPPKNQFKKDGSVAALTVKFLEKHGGKYWQEGEKWMYKVYDEYGELPIPAQPVLTHEPATVKDTTHIKGWLIQLGWRPTMYKERDLTCDSKKNKLTQEKFEEAVNRYVEQTLNSPFCRDRCEELNVSKNRLRDKLLAHDITRPLKVYTNPTITVGMEKEIDPALLDLAEKFPHAKLVSEFLTYSHRRNSILGGGVDPDEIDDEDDEWTGKGFLAAVRSDGRIPTPADTCGAGTSRFKHKVVANIPRVTSLYGYEMRDQFGVDVEQGFVQLGYDFDSLEAKIEAHYVYKYPGGPEYGVSLTAEKPNDCHSVLARAISILLGREFPRGTAKNVKYGCLPVDNTEVLTKQGWKRYGDICVGDFVAGYHAEAEAMYWTEVIGLHFYPKAEVGLVGNKRWNVEATADHRWLATTGYSSSEVILEYGFDLQTNSRIINSAPMVEPGDFDSVADAAVIGWMLSDGHWSWSEAQACKQNSNGVKLGCIANIGQDDSKYCAEVRQAIEAAGISYKTYKAGSMNEFRLDSSDFRKLANKYGFFGKAKKEVDWVEYVIKLSNEARSAFLEAFWLADGRSQLDNAYVVRQRPGVIADAVALAYSLQGNKTTVRVDSDNMATINAGKTNCTGFQTGKFVPTRLTDVFCLSTRCESFFIRQGGVLTLTGNCSYNAQPPRVAKTVGCDLETAKIIFDAFWEQASPLKQLKERMQKYWETTGQKKFLMGLDNRKLPIRSKGNVINTAFQSAGVICAKRAMVMHEAMLKEEGMYVDFFREDWKNKKFCQQLIAYHDEAQLEVHKSLVTWKKFASEEECKAWKPDDGRVWSDPFHNDKGWFRGYCRAGELATIAVRKAGEYYNLNVPLSAGYMLGTSWASCH